MHFLTVNFLIHINVWCNALYLFIARKFLIASITSSFRHLKSGKASGVDGLAAEHFLNADRPIYVYLSLLFNSFLYHGYLPAEFMKTAIVPIIKCKTGTLQIRIITDQLHW